MTLALAHQFNYKTRHKEAQKQPVEVNISQL
jgi:hypothetical protein